MTSFFRLLCLAALGSALSVQAQVSFTFTDLGTLSGGTQSSAFGLNSSGTVVGGATTTASATPFYAYSYSGGTMTSLGVAGGSGNSEARAINSSGTIVGISSVAGGQNHAFSYNGTFTDLLTLGGSTSQAYSINNDGVIVGYSQMTGNTAQHAFRYSGGGMTDLGTIGGTNSTAWDINSAGTIVGQGQISGDTAVRAWVLASGTLSSGNSLGTFGGNNSMAFAVNNSDIVVGHAQNSSGYYRAFSYNGSLADLGTLGGNNSTARDINANNYIVGTSEITAGQSATRAFLYMGGTMYNLNDYVSGASGWTLLEAWGINDANQIVGVAIDGSSNKHAFMLTAVPEPSAYASALAAIALVATIYHRHKRRKPAARN